MCERQIKARSGRVRLGLSEWGIMRDGGRESGLIPGLCISLTFNFYVFKFSELLITIECNTFTGKYALILYLQSYSLYFKYFHYYVTN